MTVRRTRRWRGIVAVALFVGGVGVVAARPLVLLLGVVGAAFAAYPHLTTTPEVSLDVDRRSSDDSPDDGEAVTVTVRVQNTGSGTLADLRLVDGVPPMLRVTDGSPRHAAVLRPGSTTEFEYTVEAERGRHRFEPVTVVARDVAGTREVETTVDAETELACTSEVPEMPLRQQTERHSGRLITDEGGSGIEFHQTREYRHGDPMSRIDWKRHAKTGELTTIEFREERTASVVLLVDATVAAYRARRPDEQNAVAHSLAGAEQMLSALSNTRNFVGVAGVGREFAWLAPGIGPEHDDAAKTLLATSPTFSTVPPGENKSEREGDGDGTDDEADTDDGEWNLQSQHAELQRRLGSNAQVVLLSPLTDPDVVGMALGLEANGTRVTVVSPDVTSDATLGGRLAATERDNRIRSLRESGIPVVDWDPETERLGTELLRTQEQIA
ncbi:Uncharacterized conserved protein, DUF58 family, contains vWF domain [Halogranum amylolyticum]|uniref:Uncharacterized conserved protein, DUF58 family, contains vWF domain n=1 Tax=Halogranum amylolyticum TaxID=660520 RepID=A0A1H8WLN8_9EURY|nr:DUF58 domain-containing protein [Halogranum amylolyticum]SEP28008.1 Uncharacterized conserved protein, DUF58 family, contains vWF domain [Halogranum amylolyticum]